MKGYFVTCVVVFYALELIWSVETSWEVLNDVKPIDDDDKATQNEILSREELLPYIKPKRKPRVTVVKDTTERKRKTETKTAPVLLKRPKNDRRGDLYGEDELLPHVLHKVKNRHLLQVQPLQDPRLTREAELRRSQLQQKLGYENLSVLCKDGADDEDCLYNIDDLINLNMPTELQDSWHQGSSEDHPLRRRRQANNGNNNNNNNNAGGNNNNAGGNNNNNNAGGNNNNNAGGNNNNNNAGGNNNNNNGKSQDNEVEGSGDISEDLYKSQDTNKQKGKYTVKDIMIGLIYNHTNISDSEAEAIRQELERKLTEKFSNVTGFVEIKVTKGKLQNNTLIFDFELKFDASLIPDAGNPGLENQFKDELRKVITEVNKLDIMGHPVRPTNVLGPEFTVLVVAVLNNHCGSDDPCPNAGPEFNRSTCTNDGFLSGYCLHVCTNFPCQNGAICEVWKKNYSPFCNCGTKWEGKHCEKAKVKGGGLTTGQTAGVIIASVCVCLCLSCCVIYIVCFRRGRKTLWTFWEDQGSSEHSHPPISPNWFCDRPSLYLFHDTSAPHGGQQWFDEVDNNKTEDSQSSDSDSDDGTHSSNGRRGSGRKGRRVRRLGQKRK
ncbi:hypothetical protein ACOMHN_036752 [Nucella lapillus]